MAPPASVVHKSHASHVGRRDRSVIENDHGKLTVEDILHEPNRFYAPARGVLSLSWVVTILLDRTEDARNVAQSTLLPLPERSVPFH